MLDMLTNISKVFFLYSARLVLPYLPLKVIYFLGDILGYMMVGGKKELIRKEVILLLGCESKHKQDRIIRRYVQNVRKNLLEIWTFSKLNRKKINNMIYLEGNKHLDKALSKGKGAILCVTHLGSHKIVIPAMGYNGYKVNQVAANPQVFVRKEKAFYHNKIMKLELESESFIPARFIYVKENKSVRPIYRALKENEIVLISLDGVIETERLTVPFLNSNISLATGAALLSFHTGAPAFPIFPIRQKDNRHKIIIHEPIEIQNMSLKEDYIKEWVLSFAYLFQGYVKNYPDHYIGWIASIKNDNYKMIS